MFKIIMSGMQFHAFHGLYGIEKEKGGLFEIDLELDIRKDIHEINDDIRRTYDYSSLYERVAATMANRVNLLEEIACRLSENLKSDSLISDYIIRVKKLTPPLPGPVKCITVELDSRKLSSS